MTIPDDFAYYGKFHSAVDMWNNVSRIRSAQCRIPTAKDLSVVQQTFPKTFWMLESSVIALIEFHQNELLDLNVLGQLFVHSKLQKYDKRRDGDDEKSY